MKKVLNVVFNVVLWIVLIFALTITLLVLTSERNEGVASLFGYMPMSVSTDSMKGTFSKGDVIICKKIDDLYKLEKDDVITFYTLIGGKRSLNTHRIVEVTGEGNAREFVTKGDNNAVKDESTVSPGDIVGEWTGVKLKGVGKVFDFLRTKTGFFVCIIIPLAIFFLFELYRFIVTVNEVKYSKMDKEKEEEIRKKAVEEYLQKQAGEQAGDAQEAQQAEPSVEQPVVSQADDQPVESQTDTQKTAGSSEEAE